MKKVNKIVKYETVEKFAKRVSVTRRTIFRFYAKNPDIKKETEIRKGKRLIPIVHSRFWNVEELFQNNKTLSENNRMMNNTLDALQNANELSRKLWFLKWTHIITISPRKERSLDYCTSKVRQYYSLIDSEFGAETNLRIFYNAEKHDERDGYHIHIVLNVESEKFHSEALALLKQDFKYDRIEVNKYDYCKGFLFYAIKNEKDLNTISWGIDGNNLLKENISYEV